MHKKVAEIGEYMNIVVGQSGGPTTVINASLAGVYQSAVQAGVNKVYGMQNGISAFLQEKKLTFFLPL